MDSNHALNTTNEGTSQTDRVAMTLREMLLRGEFRPGERLAELTLVPMLKASRTPVRLALERLSHQGLLEAQPAGGFRVREFTVDDIWDAIEMRGVLEGTAARLSAERLASKDELEPLRASCERLGQISMKSAEDFVLYLEENETFHQELWKLSKSNMLMRTLEAVCNLPFAEPGALVFFGVSGAEAADAIHATMAYEHHRSLVDAIEQREGTRAEFLAREHSRMARHNLGLALRDRELFNKVPGSSLVVNPE
jgi:GntR family transcriptional regulator, vanillate catabolism transcriptional regulator